MVLGDKKSNWKAENEGKSHDVVENKGPAPEAVGKSHDFFENKTLSLFGT